METNTKIQIKRSINKYPALAQGLKRNSKTFDDSIKEFARITDINENFLRLNIDRLRNWID